MIVPELIGRARWYRQRLSTMTPGELAWRAARAVEERTPSRDLSSWPTRRLLVETADWHRLHEDFRAAAGRPVVLGRERVRRVAADHPEAAARLVAAAERVVDGRVTYFGYPEVRLAEPPDWHHDPLRDHRWPAREARRIDHRASGADPKWIWELNRLQHLPWLAQAWLITGDDRFAESALVHLDSWVEQNPVGQGIAWRGAFEAGIRAISVVTALQGLRECDGLDARRLERYVRMLAAGADVCWRQRSLHSSANNHLVGELAGLAFVAVMFPELRPAARWERDSVAALEVEASRQILPDGTGAEQAVGYQVFTVELLLLVAALLTERGGAAPAAVLDAIDRSTDHLVSVVGTVDPEPRAGDDDEGFAIRLGPEPRRTVRQHLGFVAAFRDDPRARRSGVFTLSAAWASGMGGPSRARNEPAGPGEDALNHHADSGGLVVLRHAGQRLTMDVGPLGYLSIAAHGHADALALTLSLDGQEVIGDPGAGSYYGHPEWRAAHRGTRVHATVTVDDADQSVAGGPFLWTEHARVQVRSVDLRTGVVDAEHHGYRRLPDPVTHRRWLVASGAGEESTVVVDELTGRGEHQARVSWPLHPDLDVTQVRDGFALSRQGRPVMDLLMAASGELVIDRVRGDTSTQLGWWSERLEARRPAWLLGGVVRGTVPLVLVSVLAPRRAASRVSDPAVTATRDVITLRWHAGTEVRTLVIDRSGAGGAAVTRHRVLGRQPAGSAR